VHQGSDHADDGGRDTRHALACGLAADLAGVLGAIFVAYLFFG